MPRSLAGLSMVFSALSSLTNSPLMDEKPLMAAYNS